MKQKLFLLLALPFCWANTWADVPQVNNVYQISTPEQLVEFATVVSTTTNAKAVLTADITLTSAWATPIGTESAQYTGTFDGQGHSITGFNLTTNGQSSGLFGSLGNKAVVKNFTIEGTISSKHQYVGVIGSATGTTVNISDIHSKLNITSSVSRVGGILGAQTGNGTININRCRYSGTFSPSVAGNFGGIIGLTYNNTSAYVNITDCLFDGTISFTGGSNTNAGGFVGYTRSCHCTIQNCFSNGSISADDPGQFVGQLNKINNNSTATNFKFTGRNYYVSGTDIATGTGVRDESSTTPETVSTQLTSGELCYALNGNAQGGVWRQTLTTDAAPTILDTSHKKLYKWHGVLYNDVPDLTISNEDDMLTFAAIVNGEANTVNAELDQNITLTSWPKPIGDWSTGTVTTAYKGHFNGNGRTITLPTVTSSQNYFGLFGVLSTDALIEGFSISGTITANKQCVGGVAAYARETPTIRNIQCSVTINNSYAGGRQGGILGASMNGTVTIQNCTYTGTLHNDNITGNYGGIVGYVNNNNNATLTIRNCLFAGIVEDVNGGTGECGGIVGYIGDASHTTIENSLSVGIVSSEKQGMICGKITGSSKTLTNNFYKDDSGTLEANGPDSNAAYTAGSVITEQLASGEVCYLLNGSISGGTNWFQTLNGTGYPLPYGSDKVYANGRAHCNGDTYADATYSNEDLGTITDSHNFVDGFCTYCNTLEENYITPIDGNYMIGTPAQLKWFAAFVNAGHQSANAKLANITPLDLTGVAVEPIGNSSAAYTGTFDGQGKSITGFSATSTGNGGLFGNINNATIKDFSIDGVLDVTGGTASGVIGYSKGSIISGIHSSLTITTSAGTAVGHVGGVVGSLNQNDNVSGCSFSGSITVNANSHNCFGGIVGYMTSNDKIQNCANYGSITYSKNNCYAGGIEGYINATSASIQNCLSTGAVTYVGEGTATYGGAIVGYLKSAYNAERFSDNYWLTSTASKAYGSKTDEANEVDAAKLASGEIAYKLGSAWYQTIDTDDTPVLDSSSEKVLYVGTAGYSTMYAANDWELVGDAKAYIGTISGSALHLDEIADIPAGTAVVISGTYYNKVSTTATANTTDNVLKGSNGSVTGGEGIYALAIKNDKVGFYPVAASVTIPDGKAYLEYKGTGGGAVKGFTFVFDDDATGIEDLKDSKDLKDSNVIYNIAGQRLDNSQFTIHNSQLKRGIYIVNGKKVLK